MPSTVPGIERSVRSCHVFRNSGCSMQAHKTGSLSLAKTLIQPHKKDSVAGAGRALSARKAASWRPADCCRLSSFGSLVAAGVQIKASGLMPTRERANCEPFSNSLLNSDIARISRVKDQNTMQAHSRQCSRTRFLWFWRESKRLEFAAGICCGHWPDHGRPSCLKKQVRAGATNSSFCKGTQAAE